VGDFFVDFSRNKLLINVFQGLAAFIATNLDDIVVLMIFFTNEVWRPRQVVAGQYLGFVILVLLSLPGYFGGALVPAPWIGLLGLVPLGIGLKLLMTSSDAEAEVQTVENSQFWGIEKLIPLPVLQVAAVTIANGGDNIGIYVPLFASKSGDGLMVILLTFGLMVGVWCAVAWQLVQHRTIGNLLNKYGDRLVPWVFMGLGGYILYESKTVPYFLKSFFNL
jgi:cadmium resistance transport/sequestration family protein